MKRIIATCMLTLLMMGCSTGIDPTVSSSPLLFHVGADLKTSYSLIDNGLRGCGSTQISSAIFESDKRATITTDTISLELHADTEGTKGTLFSVHSDFFREKIVRMLKGWVEEGKTGCSG
jgi:hypothetical protein